MKSPARPRLRRRERATIEPNRWRRSPASFLVVLVAATMTPRLLEPVAHAAGPGQPEVQSFEAISTTDLVNPFTGDLTYNIPLMDVGGYPLNLAYQSGVTMDQEASFVGLGWNLNPGVILRNVRGLPDDFAGEEITKEVNLAPNVTAGASVGVGLELFGYDGLSVVPVLSVGGNYNTYRGPGVDFGLSSTVSSGEGAKTSATLGLGLSSNSGVTVSPSVSFSGEATKTSLGDASLGAGIGLSWDSREGLQDLTFRSSYDMKWRTGGEKSLSAGVRFSFVNPTYTPAITTPMRNLSLSLRLKLGGEVFGTTGTLDLGGYYSRQEVAERSYRIPAYGYIFAHRAGGATRVLHDFNRENDGPFVPTQPNLPLAHLTYDLYSVSAQGLQAQFRPFRSDVGSVFDHEVDLGGAEGGSLSIEVAGGNTLKAGADVVVNLVGSRAGPWRSENPAYGLFEFKGEDPDNPAYEPAYFRQVGETTASSRSRRLLFDQLGGDDPMSLQLDGQAAVLALVAGTSETPIALSGASLASVERERRNLHFSFLTAAEASEAGLERQLRTYVRPWETYDPGFGVIPRYDSFDRVDAHPDPTRRRRLPHHMSEITVTRDDGTRYVYGLPLYNNRKEEVTFNVSGRVAAERERARQEGLAPYVPTDDGFGNEQGRNHYFERTHTPPYVYAFYLTAVVSADYVDRTGDGPTSDDLGTYTKFNYRLLRDDHRWRTPTTGENRAFYQEGHTSDEEDDLASYVYGEKEIWYLDSVETRNYIAELSLSPRDDGVGIAGPRGGVPPEGERQRLLKVDAIRLFNKAERLSRAAAAVPIKTVHFFYDYTLTPGTPDSLDGRGKLTLRRVAFSYRDSQKAMLSPYVFTYSDTNPRHALQASDRWGTYKPDDPPGRNRRSPYADQFVPRGVSDDHASAWQLTGVRLPSGGQLRVEYESDDYGYVQDRRAQVMVPIVGTAVPPPEGGCSAGGTGEQLYGATGNFLCFYFDLLEPIAQDDPYASARLAEYVRGIRELYVNAEVVVDEYRELREVVQTFLPVERGADGWAQHGFDAASAAACPGTAPDTCWTRGWIRLRPEQMRKSDLAGALGGEAIHPLSQAAWQQLKLEVPRLAYGDPSPIRPGALESDDGEAVLEAIRTIAGQLRDNIDEAVRGLYVVMKDDGRAARLRLGRSFMRLNHPTLRKRGGGSRVRRIVLIDEWGRMTRRTGAAAALRTQSYSLDYAYTTTGAVGGRFTEISSGVASYEPLVGGDENPLVEPIWYEHNGDLLFQRGPLGEFAFPSPVVGYREVRVTQRALAAPDVEIGGTGSTVHEFYTARDFPVVVRRTPIRMERDNPVALIAPFPYSQDHVAVSQGYAIELNDMHGKPKASWVYPEGAGSAPLSGVTYRYSADRDNPSVATLVAGDAGLEIEAQPIGLDFEAFADFREHETTVEGPGVNINVDGFLAAVFPLLIPTPYPEYSRESTRFRSAVITKLIHRSGVLEQVRAHDSGATLASRHTLWDAETGQVIVTATQTEHGGHRYTTVVPAHLVYGGMSGAWRNQGLTLERPRVAAGGLLEGFRASQHLHPGDELVLRPADETAPGLRAWVWRVTPEGATLLDRNGTQIPPGEFAGARVLRSGRRNQQAVSLGQVTTKTSPVEATRLRFADVLDAGAVEFAQHWQTYAPYSLQGGPPSCACRPLDFTRPRGDVAPVPPPSHLALRDLLAELGRVGRLEATGLDLVEVLTSDPSRRDLSDLRRYLSDHAAGWRTWDGRVDGSLLSASISNAEGESVCRVTLRAEDGAITRETLDTLDFSTLDSRRDHHYECGASGRFVVDAREGADRRRILGDSTCFSFANCAREDARPAFHCGIALGTPVNPFVEGILGSWRPQRSWAYVTDRTASDRSEEAGTLETFEPFWSPFARSSRSNWQWSQETTIVDPFGRTLETRDALGRHQSELSGFDFSVVTAVAANARPRQVATEAFEDHAYANRLRPGGACPSPTHWGFQEAVVAAAPGGDVRLDDAQRHTGRTSLRVEGGSVAVTRSRVSSCDPETRAIPDEPTYRLQPCDVIPAFSPEPGRYLLGAWVKSQSRPGGPDPVPVPRPTIEVTAGGARARLEPAGPAVDGWQRVEGEFDVPTDAASVTVTLHGGGVVAWFDDLRVHPRNADMKTYVYDPVDMRFRATLDTENYATLYDYDEEGALSGLKLETEKGILTTKEVSRGAPKFPWPGP